MEPAGDQLLPIESVRCLPDWESTFYRHWSAVLKLVLARVDFTYYFPANNADDGQIEWQWQVPSSNDGTDWIVVKRARVQDSTRGNAV